MQRRSLVSTLVSLTIALSWTGQASASDFDPMNAWEVRGGTTGMMYFKLPFHAAADDTGPEYGLALSQQPISGRSRDLNLMFDSPKLMNVSFTGYHLDDVRLANRSLLPSRMDSPDGPRHSVLGMGNAGWFVVAGGVALAAFGIAELADSDQIDDPDPE